MNFLNIIKHLLPRSKAWNLIINKRLRQFFEGIAASLDDFKIYFDLVWLDIFPQTTRNLEKWERQWGLRFSTNLTEQQRRDRLDATWQAVGGQNPRYIQDTLQANGFNVFVHEWWIPFTTATFAPLCGQAHVLAGSGALATGSFALFVNPVARNPFSVIENADPLRIPSVDCGEDFAECGEDVAECGNIFVKDGYLLVNKISGVTNLVPDNQNQWRFILYIGGENFGDLADIPQNRREEFETLCIKICPMHLWLGMMIRYI